MTQRDTTNPEPPGGFSALNMDRRQFLTMTGAGAAMISLERTAEAALPAVPVVYPLSVGFVEGSDELESLEEMPWESAEGSTEAIPAADMGGDQSLALSPITVRVVGLYPRWPWPGRYRFEKIDLDVAFPLQEPGAPSQVRYQAWSFRRRPAPDLSPPVRFRMWTGASDGLGTRILVQDAAKRVRQYETSFTVDWADGVPRLKRGIYLLGLDAATWADHEKLPGAGDPPDYTLRSVILTVQPLPPPV